MKILLLGDADSIWMLRYVTNVCLKEGNQIYIASVRNKQFADFYARNNIKVVAPRKALIRVNKYNLWRYALTLMKKIVVCLFWGKFDVIHIQYVTFDSLFISKIVARSKSKVISSYWGSDLLRKPQKVLEFEKKYLKSSDVITCETDYMLQKLREAYGNQFDSKIYQVLFGITGLDDIKEKKIEGVTKEDCKKNLGIKKNKVVIAVGYNGIKEQQHLEALKCISRLPDNLRKNIHIILQMTYGNPSIEYMSEINQALQEMNMEYIIFTDFLKDAEIAEIRIATDVFVHAQTTDSLSATIQESLYNGTVVCNPKWICYDILKTKELQYFEYADWNQLNELLQDILENLEGYQTRCFNNSAKMYELAAWSSVSKKWIDLYEGGKKC